MLLNGNIHTMILPFARANKERIAYAKDDDEPFTGVGVSPKRKGSLGWESRFLNGKLHGKKTLFYPDGSILSEEPYLNGKASWSVDRFVLCGCRRLNWEKQHINGKQISDKVYFRSGSVRIDTLFKDGKPVLKSTWDKDGNLVEKRLFNPSLSDFHPIKNLAIFQFVESMKHLFANNQIKYQLNFPKA